MSDKISIENNDLPEEKKAGVLNVSFDESSIKHAKKSIKKHKRKRSLMLLSLLLFIASITGVVLVCIKKVKLVPISLAAIMLMIILAVMIEVFYLKTEKYI